MENGGGGVRPEITADQVISKLKDDGDFDRLRRKIIRKLKENEELRNSIISTVKQSAALNHPEAETMRRQQLSDAIHQEVRDQVMEQISDSLWGTIRSSDGMKDEITETVQSVYNKLLNPLGSEEQQSLLSDTLPQADNVVSDAAPHETGGISGGDLAEPPGFSVSSQQLDNPVEQLKEEDSLLLPVSDDKNPVEEKGEEDHHPEDSTVEPEKDSVPADLPVVDDSKQPFDGSDDDPDLPPGFS